MIENGKKKMDLAVYFTKSGLIPVTGRPLKVNNMFELEIPLFFLKEGHGSTNTVFLNFSCTKHTNKRYLFIF